MEKLSKPGRANEAAERLSGASACEAGTSDDGNLEAAYQSSYIMSLLQSHCGNLRARNIMQR